MIYLGSHPIGLLSIPNIWTKLDSLNIQFTVFNNYSTADSFLTDATTHQIKTVIDQLTPGDYKIVFVNNTDNERAGQWIKFTKTDTGYSGVSVMRVGLTSPQGNQYGVNVYPGATGDIYRQMVRGDA